MCCPEPDDVQYDMSLYGCGQIIELNDFCVLFAVPSTPMLCYDCGVAVRLTVRSQLHAVLTVAMLTGEAR